MNDACLAQLWRRCETFDQIKAMNLLFVEGIIPWSPYHGEELDPESDDIIVPLRSMNSLGWITYNSQPYDYFEFYKSKQYGHQYAFLSFFMRADQVQGFVRLITQHDIQYAIKIGGQFGNDEILGDANIPFLLSSEDDPGKVPTLGVYLEDPFSTFTETFRPADLVDVELETASVHCTTTRHNNDIFYELERICYHLYLP